MMGKDVERIVSGIDAVKEAAMSAVVSLAGSTGYQLISREQHVGLGTGPCRPEEIGVPDGDPMSAVSSAMGGMSSDCGKMDSLRDNLYTGATTFNNGIGSPWTELTRLQKAVSEGSAYSGAHAPFNYVGEKAGMLSILNMIVSAAVDAKWAIVVYHDYIQRGYDNKFNGNEPSISFDRDLDQKTVGNVRQDYEENVNIPRSTLDPF